MFSSMILRRRRRAFSWIFLGLATFVFLCMWNFSSMDSYTPHSSVHRFRLFGGASDDDLPLDFYKLPADDPTLVRIVRNRFIRPPSSMDYNLTRPDVTDFSRGQSPVIDELLHGKVKGYFVECGAYDGEQNSVTLFFEKQRRWEGLLVEPDHDHYTQILRKHRQAHTIHACVRTDFENFERPEKSTEEHAFFKGKSRDGAKSVPCFWITTLLMATGQKTIDLLSLDLGGNEMTMLKTLDFSKIKLKTITMEMSITSPETEVMDMLNFMKPRGLTAVHQFTDHIHKTKDLVLKTTEV